MKKTITFLIMLALFLTACGSAQVNATQTSGDLPTATQLAAGTLKLEDTDQAVSTEQATELLFLWQVYQELNSNDSAAQAEYDGLTAQIQETMTAEQLKAISSMDLTQQDVFSLMQGQGAGMAGSSNNATQSTTGVSPSNAGGMPGGAAPDAGMGAGAPPDGGVIGMSGSGTGSSTSQSQNAGAGTGVGSSTTAPTALVGVLIQVLEQKVSS